MNKVKYFLLAGLTGLSIGLIGQTVIPGTIASDYSLTRAGSPYIATTDVNVLSGASLTVDEGVTIYFKRNSGLYVRGSVQMNGSSGLPIRLVPEPGGSEWETVTIYNTRERSFFQYVEFRGCTEGDEPNRDRAALNANNVGEVSLDHVDFREVEACLYFIDATETCTFENSYFSCTHRGSVFNLVRMQAIIRDNEFAGVVGTNSDAIDFDKVVADITGNTIYGMTGPDSDGIDMGSASVVYLRNNVIRDCSDSGIEAEEETILTAERNVIINCGIGFTVKELAVATLTNNTLVETRLGFSAYSENSVYGRGGNLTAINNIIAGSNQIYSGKDGSELSFRYCLTFPGTLTGTGNFEADPLFANQAGLDFNLLPGSPAIDAGDPASGIDPDGTPVDIGAFWHEQAAKRQIEITEIHYRSWVNKSEVSNAEFIEIYN